MSTFEELFAALPANKKFTHVPGEDGQESGTCVFGMNIGLYSKYYAAITSMPARVDEVLFMDTGHCEQLLAAFVESDYAQQVSSLSIGGSSDMRGRLKLDYSGVASILAGAKLPKLRELTLGVWELLCNESCAYGQLGDLAPMLENLQSLEVLELYGDLELSRAVHLPRLSYLSLDIGSNNAYESKYPLSQQSLEHLLQLSPALRTLELLLSYDFAVPYHFPSAFLEGKYTPLLQKLDLESEMHDQDHVNFSISPLLAKPGLEHRCWRVVRNRETDQSTEVRINSYRKKHYERIPGSPS